VGREWLIKTTLSLLPVDIISCGGMNLGLLWPVVFLLLPLVGGVSTSEELESSSSESSTILDDGGFGMGMLRDSIRRSKDAGVTSSCTVRLDEKIYCIRDDGEWKDCPNGPGVNDLVIAIEKLYQSS